MENTCCDKLYLMDRNLSSMASGLEIGNVVGRLDIPVKGIAIDSNKIEPGFIFFCLRGFKTDGHQFAGQAAEAGAGAVIVEKYLDLPVNITQVIVKDTRTALAEVSANFFGHPSRQMKLVGVTGTNGKTTTCFFLEEIFRSSGLRTGLIGTVEIHLLDKILPVTHTTPEPLHLQSLLAEMVSSGVEALPMEVSSHAVDQNRVRACDFDVVAFTNLTQDHLDYHGDMESYYLSKLKLFMADQPFGAGRVAVINIDDESGKRIVRESDLPVIRIGTSRADLVASVLEVSAEGSIAKLLGMGFDDEKVDIGMPGHFNVMNALTAAAAARVVGLDVEHIIEGIESLKSVPGRFERVSGDEDFAVIVDYAHTPDSLEKTLDSARSLCAGRLISVFGCGGDRDKEKRALMGGVSARSADFTIITSDNPRSEDPEEILNQVEEGIKGKGISYSRITNRREAIETAISMAMAGDIVVIAGKGHEKGQIFADRVVPFDDREVAREALTGVRDAT